MGKPPIEHVILADPVPSFVRILLQVAVDAALELAVRPDAFPGEEGRRPFTTNPSGTVHELSLIHI